jgi:hypothetical protein
VHGLGGAPLDEIERGGEPVSQRTGNGLSIGGREAVRCFQVPGRDHQGGPILPERPIGIGKGDLDDVPNLKDRRSPGGRLPTTIR